MANDKLKVQFTGIVARENDGYDMIITISSDVYHSLRYHLANSAEHHEYFNQIEDAVNIRQSLDDAWRQARDERDRFEEEEEE